jgi:hypothetical protein
MLGIWIDERLPRYRMREVPYTRSIELARAFTVGHGAEIAHAIAAARTRYGDEAELDDVFELLRPMLVAFVGLHLGCTLLERPRPPW